MLIGDLIYQLQGLMDMHGDLPVHDSDHFEIEEVSKFANDDCEYFVIYSEGDDH